MLSMPPVDTNPPLRIGIAEAGIRHSMSRAPTLDTAFPMVKDCGAFDYVDKTPPRSQVTEYLRLSERFNLPVLAGGWWYTLGRDEELLAENLKIGADLGSIVHNVQIMMDHADGRLVTDQEVADAYARAHDLAQTRHVRKKTPIERLAIRPGTLAGVNVQIDGGLMQALSRQRLPDTRARASARA